MFAYCFLLMLNSHNINVHLQCITYLGTDRTLNMDSYSNDYFNTHRMSDFISKKSNRLHCVDILLNL